MSVVGIAAGVSIAGTLATTASGLMGSDAAEGAAGLQSEYLDLGINELRGALGPSMERLDQEQAWSDQHLNNLMRSGMRETRPYQRAGARGLNQLNYRLGLDNGLGAAPTAPKPPKAPKALKPPKYDKDPAKAAAQKREYDNAVRKQANQYKRESKQYDRKKLQYDTDSAAYTANSAAAASDPEFGGMMDPYEDRFEDRITEVSQRKYDDKYGQRILDTSAEKYDDKYGQRILDTSAEKYDDKYAQEILDVGRDKFETDDFEADPGYEFRRSEGNRGVEQSAAARGSLLSGAALKELTRFNQDTASNEFDRAYGRWGDQRNTRLGTLKGQQDFDYGAWGDNKNSRLGTLKGQQGFDYGAWDDNKDTRLGALSGERAFDYGAWDDQKDTELDTLVNQRNFDFGNFEDNRDFEYGSLSDMVDTGQEAVDDRNQLKQYFGGQRTQNRLNTAAQQGQWRQNTANNIAEFLSQQGNAQAAGVVGAANAETNAFEGLGNAFGGLAGYFSGQQPGSGQRRWAPGAPEWWRQNRGVPT